MFHSKQGNRVLYKLEFMHHLLKIEDVGLEVAII